jgi:hypothetical protein
MPYLAVGFKVYKMHVLTHQNSLTIVIEIMKLHNYCLKNKQIIFIYLLEVIFQLSNVNTHISSKKKKQLCSL